MASKDAHLEDRSMFTSSFGEHRANTRQGVDDLLALSSLMSNHVHSDHFLASESRLIHSKFQRLFHFLLTDVQHEPMIQASGDAISMPEHVDDALINLNRSATLKFRNYKQFREHVGFLGSSEADIWMRPKRLVVTDNGTTRTIRSTGKCTTAGNPSSIVDVKFLPSSSSMASLEKSTEIFFTLADPEYIFPMVHQYRHLFGRGQYWLIRPLCTELSSLKITVAITTEYNSPGDSKSKVYIIAVFVNRCILFIYLLELIFKWIGRSFVCVEEEPFIRSFLDHFTNFWYSAVNIMEFLLTLISLINLISEIHFDTTNHSYLNQNKKFAHQPSNSTDALQRLR